MIERMQWMMSYRIPASPADPPTPVQKARIEIAGSIQHVDVGNNVKNQIDPLHNCLSVKQLHNVLAAYPPACNSIDCDADARYTVINLEYVTVLTQTYNGLTPAQVKG